MVQMSLDVALVGGAAWLVADIADAGSAWSWNPVVFLAAMGVIKALARYWEQYLGHYVAFGLLASLRVRFFEAIRPLVPAALADSRSGDLVERVTVDVDQVEVFYAHTLAPLVTAVLVPAATVGAVAVLVHPLPAAWLLAAMVVGGVIVPAGGLRLGSDREGAAGAAIASVADHLTDGIQGLADVVGLGARDRRMSELTQLSRQAAVARSRAARADGLRTFAFELTAGAGFVAVLWSSLGLMAAGDVGPAPVAAGIAIALVGFVPLRDLQQVKPAVDRAMEAADRIYEIVDRRPVVDEPAASRAGESRPALEFRSVTFTYPDGATALSEVDIEIRPGRKMAVVGPSGSGKSTLAALAVRSWDPDRGSVLIGGVRASDRSLSDVRRSVAVASQRPHLLSGTVAENLRIGRADASGAAVEAAARAAALHHDVSRLTDGYDTQVGEWGGRLSGGQRQRVALARALLADTPILVLDEATSELDVDTEAEVMARLRDVARSKALLVIAHRLITVTDADEIVVLDRGRVVERGDHQSLVEAGNLYSRLWARQLDTLP